MTGRVSGAIGPQAYGRRAPPLATGFFFALGHSSVIMVAGAGLAVAASAVFGAVIDPGSGYETLGRVIGTSLAATFLYLIAVLNVVVLSGILKAFRVRQAGGHVPVTCVCVPGLR